MPFAPIDEAVEAIARGEFVVVVDDADRENEGDLIIAAEKITPEGIAFMVRHTSGVICLPVVGARLDELRIPLMVADNTESQRTAFTVSVDAKVGHQHRHLGRRPGHDHPGPHRPQHRARRLQPARPHLPAALPGGRRPQAGRPHRGRRRPRPPGRPLPGRRAVRDRQRRRLGHDGPPPRTRAVLGRARPCDDLHRRPRPLPPPAGEAGPPGVRGPHPQPLRRFHRLRLPVDDRRHRAHRHGPRRGRRRRQRPGPGPLRVPHRRRVLLTALRLRHPAPAGHAADRRGGAGGDRLPPGPRGPRHRHRPQAPGLPAPGAGPRHGRGQPGARVRRRLAGVRHRRPDPRRPRHHHHAADDQQPGQVRRPGGLQPRDRRTGAAASRCPTWRTSTTSRPRRPSSATTWCSTPTPKSSQSSPPKAPPETDTRTST